MTTEHQACGLGSFFPMSCRGRAEAFARRLQSRLQSLGRAGSGDGASSPDESTWLAEQPEVNSNQPRHSSSPDSDVYFDFDLDCDSPGSPVDEATFSETLPDYLVNKGRAFHCPPRTQYSSESGCILSPSTITGTSPGSDSSDGPYFDPEISDSETTTTSRNNDNTERVHESHPEPISTQENPHNEPTSSENGSYSKMNGHASLYSGPYGERKFVLRRNFRNAAGFRISSPEKEIKKDCTDSPENPSNIIALNSEETNTSKNGIPVSSNESSTTDEYFECSSLKSEESLSEDLSSLCVHDSGYPNTAESSRCNSQNETRLPHLETDYDSPTKCKVSDLQHNISNGDSNTFDEPTTRFLTVSEPQGISVDQLSDICSSHDSSSVSKDCTDGDNIQSLEETAISSSSESLHTSPLARPCKLTLDCSASIDTDVQSSTESNKSSETETMTEEDDDDKSVPRVRRCSSLKTGKTPPGTPGRKKIVRFADVLGLDLADIRTFLDEIPKVPLSAYEDLSCADIPDGSAPSLTDEMPSNVLPTCISGTSKSERCLIPLFQQPGGQPDFMDRIREDQVCLENALITDAISYTISGTVRVRNLDFHKSVHIRYSLDGWKTFADLQATYVQNSCDGFSDKFNFTLYAHTVQVGQRLEFAVRFQCRGAQYWDSNRGSNYVFQCLPTTDRSSSYAPIPISPIEQFSISFY